MPPKSSSKKSQILWYFCEVCKVNITQKERNDHEKFCPILSSQCCSYIRNEILYTTMFEGKLVPEELSDFPDSLVKQMIYISESAMKLCQFVIGERVAVSCKHNSLAPQVRLVWPIPSKFLTYVFVGEKDYNTNWKDFQKNQIKIEKLQNDPLHGAEIVLKFISDSNLPSKSLKELEKRLQVELRSQVFCEGNEIRTKFYNKMLHLKILTIQNATTESSHQVEVLEERFRSLVVDTTNEIKFYQVTHGTKISIEGDALEDDCDKFKVAPILKLLDVGGLDTTLKEIQELIDIALGLRPAVQGFRISRCVLLYGPSGCGKTMLCEALANELPYCVVKINSAEIFSKFLGESEENLLLQFNAAFKAYPRPSIIIIEDLSGICPKNETNDTIRRLSVAFCNILDSLHVRHDASRTFVLTTTSNIENLSPKARRSGRIDVEIEIPIPNPQSRKEILEKLLSKVQHILSPENVRAIADSTHGYVGSDLANLVSKAALEALNTTSQNHILALKNVASALNVIKPSAMREVQVENPNVRWEDIGGQEDLKLKLRQTIEWPLLHAAKFTELSIKPPRGILMFGPPGCSKTMIAKALATESSLNFLSIKGPELFSMWVGESERAVREVFRKARQVAPAIVFFDEIDAIGSERGSSNADGTSVKERVLAQLLTELDGVNTLENVTILAATNRPDMIDKALMRPGRIDRIVYVGLPDAQSRREIFRIKLKKMPLDDDVSLEELVNMSKDYSGAEIQAVCHEAGLNALEESLEANHVKRKNFEHALKMVRPRTSQELLNIYDDYMKKV